MVVGSQVVIPVQLHPIDDQKRQCLAVAVELRKAPVIGDGNEVKFFFRVFLDQLIEGQMPVRADGVQVHTTFVPPSRCFISKSNSFFFCT